MEKAKSEKTNRIVERFRKTLLQEFYRIAFRKKISVGQLRPTWTLGSKPTTRTVPIRDHGCFGKTPMQTFLDATPLAKDKLIAA